MCIKRLSRDERRAVILAAAVSVANQYGLTSVTHARVAAECSVPTTSRTVKNYFSRRELWGAVLSDVRTRQRVITEAKDFGVYDD